MEQTLPSQNVFNLMVDVTKNWCNTQIGTLSAWDDKLGNWTDVNETLTKAQISDPIETKGADGRYYLDSVAYEQWLDEGSPTTGALHDTVDEQCLMVTGYSIDDYNTYVSDPSKLGAPARVGLQQVATGSSMDDFISANFANGNSDYLNAISSTFMVYVEGLLGEKDSDEDSYSTNMTTLNSIASTQSAKANSEEQPSSNAVNTEGSIIQQTTSSSNVITGANQQLQDVLSSLISSGMGKF
ncbi:MAG: hypothetical protein A3F67_01595 [Verrucomicrobia bacterium RIFCSPHIGHO2_12_FULL_41_10]|nr:MAG: hypothetical protein A3F67_01595 [Verrucomicrobia bacterium RIFCSPHIGHO2_12_FULL_41_10]